MQLPGWAMSLSSYNSTCSVKHGISMDQLTFYKLLVLACSVSKKTPLRLLLMVPPQQYDAFVAQKIAVPHRMLDDSKEKRKSYFVQDVDEKVKYVTNPHFIRLRQRARVKTRSSHPLPRVRSAHCSTAYDIFLIILIVLSRRSSAIWRCASVFR